MPAAAGYTGADYVHELAVAAGSRHLIAGQVMDIEAEGQKLTVPELRPIHEGKDRRASHRAARLGAMSAGRHRRRNSSR